MNQHNFNFMDYLEDDTWFENAARREESVTTEVLAGYDWGTELGTMVTSPERYQSLMLVRSIIFQAWQTLVTEWNLGIGAAAVEARGHELIMARLSQAGSEVQETLMTLVSLKLSKPQGEWPISNVVHSQIRALFSQVLTSEDWDDIATTAAQAVQKHITSQILLPQSA